jgi:hypothetical protein
MDFSRHAARHDFTRLHAHIIEEDGAFTVRVQMLNHLKKEASAWGEEVTATFDMASTMIGSLATEFSIPQNRVCIKIVMSRFKDGTMH